jgi:hypothetical protein
VCKVSLALGSLITGDGKKRRNRREWVTKEED